MKKYHQPRMRITVAPHKKLNQPCQTGPDCQAGIGLIEVMLAVFLLAFGALAAGNFNTSSLTSIRKAEVHADVNLLAHEMLEILKADKNRAVNQEYNITFTDPAPPASNNTLVTSLVAGWRSRAAQALPDGLTSIDCTAIHCTVSINWRERLVPGKDTMTYNLRSSL